MKFTKATRKQAKLRLALASPSGGGKTLGALMIAKGLGGKIAVIDTERCSASLYDNQCDFDVLELSPPYSPERYIEAIKTAEDAGYDVCIVDSATHEWNGSGGCLEINDQMAAAKFGGNTWSAWSHTTPRHRDFIDAMLQSNMHIIATLRSKTETAQQKKDGGKTTVVKLGMKAEQRDGIEFEFTTVLDIVHDGHWATASKDRTGLFHEPHVIGMETGQRLSSWLNSGIAMPNVLEQLNAAAINGMDALKLARVNCDANADHPVWIANKSALLSLAKKADDAQAQNADVEPSQENNFEASE